MAKKQRAEVEEVGAPSPGERPSPRPGTRMLVLPPPSAGPFALAEESFVRLKRQHRPRVVKTSKKKRKAVR
jgi:hypothetical protein